MRATEFYELVFFSIFYSPYFSKKGGKSAKKLKKGKKKYFQMAINHKQKGLNQKTFQQSLVFINSFHFQPRTLFYI